MRRLPLQSGSLSPPGSLGRRARLRGKVRERARRLSLDPHYTGGTRTIPTKRALAVLHPYRFDHPLLYHLSGEPLAGPEFEALFLAAGWIERAERGRLSTRALVCRLDRLDEQLAAAMDEREVDPDIELPQVDEGYDETTSEVGEEELSEVGEEELLPWQPTSDRDRWEAGAKAHYAARGLVIDPALERRQRRQMGCGTARGGVSCQGWVEIDGRPVRYAPDPAFPGSDHAVYADTTEVVPEYHHLVPAPRFGPDLPADWRRLQRSVRDLVPMLRAAAPWRVVRALLLSGDGPSAAQWPGMLQRAGIYLRGNPVKVLQGWLHGRSSPSDAVAQQLYWLLRQEGWLQ